MKTQWIVALALLGAGLSPALAQDDERARLRAEIDALRAELNRVKDDLITKDRALDQVRRDYDQRLEEAQRRNQQLIRDAKLQRARLESELRRRDEALEAAYALLRKHGIEIPQPDPLQKVVEINFPADTTLAEAAEFLQIVAGVRFELQDGAGDRALPGGLRVKQLSLKNALALLLAGLDEGEPLQWKLEDGVIHIGPKPSDD